MTTQSPDIDPSSAVPSTPGRMWTRVDGLDFVAIRVFDAPRELVFEAWSSCEHLSRWWGPTGWTLPVCDMDFRPGGTWFYGMQGPSGEMAHGLATYQEIVAPSRIVFEDAFADAERNVITSLPVTPVTIQMTESNGRTTLTSSTRYASTEDIEKVLAMGMIEGLTETWDRLEGHLATV